MTQLTLTLKMTTAQVVETSVTVNNNSPIQDYVHPDDQTQPFEMTPGFKPFTVFIKLTNISQNWEITYVSQCVLSNSNPDFSNHFKKSKLVQISGRFGKSGVKL